MRSLWIAPSVSQVHELEMLGILPSGSTKKTIEHNKVTTSYYAQKKKVNTVNASVCKQALTAYDSNRQVYFDNQLKDILG